MKDKYGVQLYKPQLEDLWFRESFMMDPETMSYNDAWGGTIPFPKEKWETWYNQWVNNPEGKRFYRYVATGRSRQFVGEVAYHFDDADNIWLADVIIMAKFRGRGYGSAALRLLCDEARNHGVATLRDNIAINNPAIHLFLAAGFVEEYRTDEIIMLKKELSNPGEKGTT